MDQNIENEIKAIANKATEQPHPKLWERLEEQLDERTVHSRKIWPLAIAASLALLIGLAITMAPGQRLSKQLVTIEDINPQDSYFTLEEFVAMQNEIKIEFKIIE